MRIKAKSTVDSYISVPTPPVPSHVASHQSAADEEFDRMADVFRNDITHFVNAGLYLRTEMESLIIWENRMGKNTPNSSTWGPTQAEYSASHRAMLRPKAVQLKSEIEAECKNPAWVLDHFIFGPKHEISDEITQQARKEFGL